MKYRSEEYDPIELMESQIYLGDVWNKRVVDAAQKARAEGKDASGVQDAANRARNANVVEWRAEKARREAVNPGGEVVEF